MQEGWPLLRAIAEAGVWAGEMHYASGAALSPAPFVLRGTTSIRIDDVCGPRWGNNGPVDTDRHSRGRVCVYTTLHYTTLHYRGAPRKSAPRMRYSAVLGCSQSPCTHAPSTPHETVLTPRLWPRSWRAHGAGLLHGAVLRGAAGREAAGGPDERRPPSRPRRRRGVHRAPRARERRGAHLPPAFGAPGTALHGWPCEPVNSSASESTCE